MQRSLKHTYQDDGIIGPIDLFNGVELAALQSEFARWRKSNSAVRKLPLRDLPEWARALVPAAQSCVSGVVGRPVRVYGIGILEKKPDATSFVSWHQDIDQKKRNSAAFVQGAGTLWFAISESTDANGCVRFVVGSHKRGRIKHTYAGDYGNMLQRGQTVSVSEDAENICDMRLRPGQASVHNLQIVHGSRPNQTNEPRIGITVRCAPIWRPYEVEYWRELSQQLRSVLRQTAKPSGEL